MKRSSAEMQKYNPLIEIIRALPAKKTPGVKNHFHLLPRVTATASPSLSLVPGVILLPYNVTLLIMTMLVTVMMLLILG